MKKVLPIFLIIFQLILFGCESNTATNSNETNDNNNTSESSGLYITNYEYGYTPGCLVHLDENLNFIDNYKINSGLSVKGIIGNNKIYTYGSTPKMSILNTKNDTLSTFENKEGTIKEIYSINNTLWGIDNGFVHEDGKYYSKIINLDSSIEHEVSGYFVSYDTKGKYIYILVENNNNQYELLEFDTTTEKFSSHILENLKVSSFLVTLDNSILLIQQDIEHIYTVNYDNLNVANEYNQTNYQLSDFNDKLVKGYNIQLDEDHKLVSFVIDNNAKFIKINLKTGNMEEILPGIGDLYTVIPQPGIDGDYIYISLVNPNELSKIKKYNWKTGELIKEVDISNYIDTGSKQISSMYFYKNKE